MNLHFVSVIAAVIGAAALVACIGREDEAGTEPAAARGRDRVTGAPPPPLDAGSVDGSSSADAAGDGAAVDASAGVTCISKRRVAPLCDANNVCTCAQSTTIESNVHFYFVMMPGNDDQAAIGTDSPGIRALYNTASDSPIFTKTDATHTKYAGYNPSREYVLRNGNRIDVSESGDRSGSIAPRGCESVPLIAVECSGTTTLGK